MNKDKHHKIFYNGNNWVIVEKLDQATLEKLKLSIDNYCSQTIPLEKDNDLKVIDLSTIGKNSNQYSIRPGFDNDLDKIIDEYTSICEKICKSYDIIEKQKFFSWKAAWTVTGGEGGFHSIHDHKSQDGICSVLYLRCEKEIMSPFGETYFVLNAECHNNDLITSPKTISIAPEEGNIILFPSYVLHGTYPQSSKIRNTLNVDYEISEKRNINIKYF